MAEILGKHHDVLEQGRTTTLASEWAIGWGRALAQTRLAARRVSCPTFSTGPRAQGMLGCRLDGCNRIAGLHAVSTSAEPLVAASRADMMKVLAAFRFSIMIFK
jgi:hypothetical protein